METKHAINSTANAYCLLDPNYISNVCLMYMTTARINPSAEQLHVQRLILQNLGRELI